MSMHDSIALPRTPAKHAEVLIAATARIWHETDGWKVPSQSGGGTYTVNLDPEHESCTCTKTSWLERLYVQSRRTPPLPYRRW